MNQHIGESESGNDPRETPPDFDLTTDSRTRAGHAQKQAVFLERATVLEHKIAALLVQHDASTHETMRLRLLVLVAALQRKRSWYLCRVRGADTSSRHIRTSRLSDEIVDLDAVLSRMP